MTNASNRGYPVNITSDQPEPFHAFASICRDQDGRIWVAWVRFQEARDSICLRYLQPKCSGSPFSPTAVVSDEPGEHFWPTVKALPNGAIVVTWSRLHNEHWRVVCKILRGDVWTDEQVISDQRGGWYPASALDSCGRLCVAWSEELTHDILLSQAVDSQPSLPLLISEGGGCCRPTLLAHDAGMLIAWDQFESERYHIRARLVRGDGSMSDIWTVSRGPQWQLQPQLGQSHGVALCCWIAQEDVRDDRGVIDQWHSIRCASLADTSWRPLGDDRAGTVADLVHGLLPQDEVRGHMGRQRYPFLRSDAGGRAWVLWERKLEHGSRCGPGRLLGRPAAERGWGPVVEVAAGHAFYEMETGQADTDSVLWATMRMVSQRPAWDVYVAPIRLEPPRASHTEIETTETEERRGWEAITLPHTLGKPQDAPVMIADGVEYHISFGDLHAHSVLSGDAEGEVDELFRYARDKAALDFVAIVDNDCYQVPMTRTAFAVSRTWAEWFNESGRFVPLPGYEWTLWDRELSNHPDHRTVLFPGRAEIFRHIDSATPTTTDLAHRIQQLGGMLFTQHWDWTLTESEAECGLEVCSAWDYYIDHPEPFHRDLCAGRRLAFIGGSDSHRRNPGTCGALTGLWTDQRSRQAIFEALRARRCFATSGSKMILDFRVDGAPMGSEVTTTGPITMVIKLWGTRPLEKLSILRGLVGGDPSGVTVVHECQLCGRYAEATWHDVAPVGTSFYYVRAKQAGEDIPYPSNISIAEGCRAWISPIWVVRR